jgi:hypothetical protein
LLLTNLSHSEAVLFGDRFDNTDSLEVRVVPVPLAVLLTAFAPHEQLQACEKIRAPDTYLPLGFLGIKARTGLDLILLREVSAREEAAADYVEVRFGTDKVCMFYILTCVEAVEAHPIFAKAGE